MANFLKRRFRKKDQEEQIVRTDMDGLSQEEQQDLESTVSTLSDIPAYQGRVRHGYSLDAVKDHQECPRCQAPTRRHYANFIYATQVAPRVMLAPAGYFCTQCPTVVIDEDMLQQGIKRRFRYQGVLGLDYKHRPQEPDLLKTWNGKPTIYIFDERQVPMGLATTGGLGAKPAGKKRRPARRSSAKRRRRKRPR